MADPNLQPSRATEEVTSTSGQGGQEVVSTKRSEGPTQVAQEVSTSASTPSGSSLRTERSVGPTAKTASEYTRKKDIFRVYQALWYILGLIEILLGFRFFLKLAGANPEAGFANFMYSITQPFAGPFLETFRATPSQGAETTSYFEWSTLIAAFVYALVVWGIIKLMQFGKPANPEEVERTVDQT